MNSSSSSPPLLAPPSTSSTSTSFNQFARRVLCLPEYRPAAVPGIGIFAFSKTNFQPSIRQCNPPRHRRPWWFSHRPSCSRRFLPLRRHLGVQLTFNSRGLFIPVDLHSSARSSSISSALVV
ncbi:hypothetical protein GALMADRAFT_1208348 [Galerina marginata CBS 339.88]|uniref:Uncharacterized protein n=1 Tax=Galerina marginata (strain CBS 339.88) TaxID=685588 RepID=A0A067SH53_GALM3|nr:hypothetical protein GALMADRAFT_1208348 [Galerina marginata CBS 339.88]